MAKSAVVSIYEVTPGKAPQFIEALRAGQKWMKEKGAGEMRVWNTVFAGENSGRVITVSESESTAAIGAATDAVMDDWANSPLFNAIAAGVMTLVSRSVMVDMTSVLE